MDEVDAGTDGGGGVDGLVHLLDRGAGVQGRIPERIDAGGALLGMRHGQSEERLLPLRQNVSVPNTPL